MADLEQAAPAAAARIATLDEALQHAFAALATLDGHLEHFTQELAEAWKPVEERANALVHSSDGARAALVTGGGQAVEALTRLTAACAALDAQGEPELDAGALAARALEDQAARLQPLPGDRLRALEERTARLAARAHDARVELRSALGEAREFLAVEVVSALRAQREEVRQAGDAARAAVLEAAREVAEASLDFETKTAEASALAASGLASARDHVMDVVDHTAGECLARHQASLVRIAALVAELMPRLAALGEAAASGEQPAGAPELADGVRDTSARVATAVGGLEAMSHLMSRYGFC